MPERVRVATWNCWGAPGGVYGFLTGTPNAPERLRSQEIARSLRSYDVICIQENFLDKVASFIEEVADLLGMEVWHDRMLPHVMQKSTYGAGLAILSAQPLDVTLEMFSSKASGFDAYASKGYATCELTTRGGERFRVVNLHLQSDDPKWAPEIHQRARSAQIAALVDGLERLGSVPTVLCGDLNVPAGSDEYHQVLLPRMRAIGFCDIAEGLELFTYAPARNSMLARHTPDDKIDARFDYIWTRDTPRRGFQMVSPPELLLADPFPRQSARGQLLYASDHFGIGVELELFEP